MGNMVWNTRKLYGKLFGAMLVLRLTSECNMQCAYCYVAEDGQPKSCTKVVSMGSVRKMLEYLEGEKTCGLQLILTGGEPLLYKPLIREIVECAEKLTIPHWIGIITNATLLDEGFLRYAKEKRSVLTVRFFDTINLGRKTTEIFMREFWRISTKRWRWMWLWG